MTNAPIPSTSPLTGQVIGQTERATRAVLDDLLAETGTGFHHWIVIRRVATTGPTVERADLVAQLIDGLKVGEEVVGAALDEAVGLGLVTQHDDAVALTPAGSDLYERIDRGVVAITARLYGDLPADDLETTRRVLSIVTERANAELADSR